MIKAYSSQDCRGIRILSIAMTTFRTSQGFKRRKKDPIKYFVEKLSYISVTVVILQIIPTRPLLA